MSSSSSGPLHPASLPVGTLVGPWRIVDWGGRGSHGAVYRAVQVDKEHSAPVALKLALVPRNPRFEREAELLSRTRSPSVPRLWEASEWQHPGGDFYPYLAMEWIDGVPLYAWARQHPLSAPQVLRLLAQLARALQSVHSAGAVHRDMKGDNVLLRRSDERAMLIDFGSGLYPEAPTLTPPDVYPGTPAYRSPESGLFELQFLRDRSARYVAGPSDDLYALGVTACRVLTGQYPQFPDPVQDEHGTWHMDPVKTPDALLQVELPLRELVLRMLSVRPEDRGSAAQLAEDLERAARSPLSHSPSPSPAPQVSSVLAVAREETAAPEPTAPPLAASQAHSRSSRVPSRRRWQQLALAAPALALLGGMGWLIVQKLEVICAAAQATLPLNDQAHGGTTALGEAISAASRKAAPEPAPQQTMAEETLPEPVPEQTRPDAKGRCPLKRQVALNGACWVPFDPEECEASFANGQVFQGRCYVPALPPHRRSTPTSGHKP